jgi:hypothetical protein
MLPLPMCAHPQPWTYLVTNLATSAPNVSIQNDSEVSKFVLEVAEDYTLPEKVYGTILPDSERIIKTFLDRKGISTGTLLTGEKGGGKTLLMKAISVIGRQYNLPTYIINKPYSGDAFNSFIQSLPSGIINIDEYEKVYGSHVAQTKLLTILDGIIKTHKLWIFTCNEKYAVDGRMINRPGRLYYYRDYSGLSEEEIIEYCDDQLKDLSQTKDILEIAALFKAFTFDMVKSLVEEMNRYEFTAKRAIEFLNIKPENAAQVEYIVSVFTGDKTLEGGQLNGSTRIHGHPKYYRSLINLNYRGDDNTLKSITMIPSEVGMKISDDGKCLYAQAATGEVVIFTKKDVPKPDLVNMERGDLSQFTVSQQLQNTPRDETLRPQGLSPMNFPFQQL